MLQQKEEREKPQNKIRNLHEEVENNTKKEEIGLDVYSLIFIWFTKSSQAV